MEKFNSGSKIALVVPFTNEDGEPITPSALSYRVTDESETELVGSSAVAIDPALGEATIALSRAINTLADGVYSGFRRVEITFTVESESVVVYQQYLLVANKLIVGSNSLQTYEQALVLSMQLGKMIGWDAANDGDRRAAMLRALDDMSRMRYQITYDIDGKITTEIDNLQNLTAEDIGNIEAIQLVNLKKAQIVQADFILGGGSEFERLQRDRVQSHTVGESSNYFSPRSIANFAVCRAAMAYLGGYVEWSISTGRG